MVPEHVQRLADLQEAETSARYERRRVIAGMVDDAARRADAMSRLEAWLRRSPERHHPS